MSSKQKQIPGGQQINETATKQRQVPGGQFVNETITAAPATVRPAVFTAM